MANQKKMKKETGIIIASSIGFFTVLGILSFRKMLKKRKHNDSWHSRLNHDHRRRYQHEDHEGVEFLSLL